MGPDVGWESAEGQEGDLDRLRQGLTLTSLVVDSENTPE